MSGGGRDGQDSQAILFYCLTHFCRLARQMIESGNSAGALTNALESQELFARAGRKTMNGLRG